MKILTPQTIGYMGACLHRQKAPTHVVTGLLGFDLSDISSFSVDSESRTMVDEVTASAGFWDIWMPKTSGEYLVWGNAVSATPVSESRVSVQCGPLKKQLFVSGESHWFANLLGWTSSTPLPFQSLPLNWEHTFGGTGFLRNPLGVGFANDAKIASGTEAAVPCVYYPNERQARLNQKIEPACFEPRNPCWDPGQARGSFGGNWLATRHPAMPEDFDWSFYNLAPLDQRLSQGYWKGDETICLEGMCVDQPVLRSKLPGVSMRCFSMKSQDSVLHEYPMVLDTVCLFPGVAKGVLVFRAELEDAGIDACLLSGIMLGAEWLGRPKPYAHYQHVFDVRSDPDVSMDYLAADHQLMPEPDIESAHAEAGVQAAALAQAAFEVQQRSAKRHLAAAAAVGAGLAFALPASPTLAAPLINALDASSELRASALKTSRLLGVQSRAMLKPLRPEPQASQHLVLDPQVASPMDEALAARGASSAEVLIGPDASPAAEGPGEPEAKSQRDAEEANRGDGVTSLVSQMGALAMKLEDSPDSLADIVHTWSKDQFSGGGGLASLDAGKDIFNAMGNDPLMWSEMANQVRAAMQEIERGSKLQQEFASSSDPVGAALARVPANMQVSMRGVLEKMLDPAAAARSGSPFPAQLKDLFGAGGGGISNALLESLAEGDSDSRPLLDDLLSSLDNGPRTEKLAELLRGGSALGLSPKLMTSQNVQGLAAWMQGQTDVKNQLANALNEAIQATGDGESLEAMLAASRQASRIPALDQWTKELALSEGDNAQWDAGVAASIDKALAQSLEGSEFSLEQLLDMAKQSDADLAPEATTKPPDKTALPVDVASAEQEELKIPSPEVESVPPLQTGALGTAAPTVKSEIAPTETPERTPERTSEGVSEGSMGQYRSPAARSDKAVLLGGQGGQGGQGGDALPGALAAGLTSRALLSQDFLAKIDGLRKRGQASISEMRRLGFTGVAEPTQRTAPEMAALAQEVRRARASGGSLKGQDLSGLDLSGVDLREMDLQGTCFEEANLSGADLSRANCAHAVFAGANISQAKFHNGRFEFANLKGATAHASEWQGADLSDSLLSMALFNHANLERATLDRCEAQNCIFEQANLSQSRCEGGDFFEVDLKRATLQGATWSKCQLFESQIDGLNARSATLVECIFSGAQGAGVDFSNANLERCNLIRAKLPYLQAADAQAPDTSWVECELSHAVLTRTLLTKAIFIEANLVQADLSSASCRGAIFTAADLTEADLSKAQLLESSLRRAKAGGANFSYANLEAAELTGADLDRCDLTGAQVIATVLAKPSHA